MATDKKLISVSRREEVGGVQQEIADSAPDCVSVRRLQEVLHVLRRDVFWNGFGSSFGCNFLDSTDTRKEEDIRIVEG